MIVWYGTILYKTILMSMLFSKFRKKFIFVSLQGESTSPSRLRRATARVAAPSVCFAVACILLAAASTAPPCFRRWRRSSPLLLSRGGLGIPESFASSPEAPLLGELSPKVTERLYEGQPCRKNQTSPSMLRIATSPIEGRPWHIVKLYLFARGSPTRGAGGREPD